MNLNLNEPTPYEKGRDLEKSIAKQMRRKGFKAYRDRRSGAGEVYKADIAAPGFAFSIEAKSQKVIKLMEWWYQAVAACSSYRRPLLIVQANTGEQLVTLTLDDFLDLMKQLEDDSQTIIELRSK